MADKESKADEEMETSEPTLEEVTERIDNIIEERPSHKEVLEFLKDVLTEQFKIKPEVETHPVEIADEEAIRMKASEGFPLVDRADLKLDMASATALFQTLCKVLKRNNKVSQDVEKIENAVGSKELDLEEVFEKTAAEDEKYFTDLLDRLNIKGEVLSFLTQNSLRPVYEAYADQLKGHVKKKEWDRSYCPICGSKPVMAELVGDERKKFLVCSLCGYKWRFMRTQCPFCDNDAASGLKHFSTEEGGKAYQVEICQKCKKYVKTVDSKELGEEVVPCVEDIGTLYLDVLAKKEGYEREVYPLGLNLEDL